MKPIHLLTAAFLLAQGAIPAAGEAGSGEVKVSKDREKMTRLQIFLDRANFGPGKIDGRYGSFTQKALRLYLQAHENETAADATPASAGNRTDSQEGAGSAEKSGSEGAPAKPRQEDLAKLDLSRVDPVFVDYEVTEADLKGIEELPEKIPELAERKSLPYSSAAEAVAEKFHCDVDYFKELNPGKADALKAGDKVKVPNVEPFELGKVAELPLKADGSRADTKESGRDKEKGEAGKPKEGGDGAPDVRGVAITIDTRDSMLRLIEDGKLVAAYPVTVGSDETKSPIGEWKVKSIARMPDFRHDKSMLEEGTRSDEAHVLPSGPNNPVGVVWIALDKEGIGIHGTNEPDTIGRSVSHGCIRTANWDVVRLAPRVPIGTRVTIKE